MTLIRLLSGSLVALVLVACAAEADPEESGESSQAVGAPGGDDPPSKLCTKKFLESLAPGNWGSWSGCCSEYNGCVKKTGLQAGNTCSEAECARNYESCEKGKDERSTCLAGRRAEGRRGSDEAEEPKEAEDDDDDDDD